MHAAERVATGEVRQRGHACKPDMEDPHKRQQRGDPKNHARGHATVYRGLGVEVSPFQLLETRDRLVQLDQQRDDACGDGEHRPDDEAH